MNKCLLVKFIKRYVLFLFLGCFITACGPREIHIDKTQEAKTTTNIDVFEVEKVHSGNLIELKDGRFVKYIGVQIPKEGNEFFEKSKQANEWLLRRGKNKVFLKFDVKNRDKSGHHLAYVYTPTPQNIFYIFVNGELIEHGFGRVEILPPNTRQAEKLLALEQRARKEKRGLWALSGK